MLTKALANYRVAVEAAAQAEADARAVEAEQAGGAT